MCGIVGAFSPSRATLAEDIYLGLYALQHRGQEAAGIVHLYNVSVGNYGVNMVILSATVRNI